MSIPKKNVNGWVGAARSWIKNVDQSSHFQRTELIDPILYSRVEALAPKTAIELGCGEGRNCRILRDHGCDVVGIDPVDTFIEAARERDPAGRYITAFAEDLQAIEGRFDLVLCVMSLSGVRDLNAVISNMDRVLKPGGQVLVIDRTSFATDCLATGSRICSETGERLNVMSNYLKPRLYDFTWGDLRVQDTHRPLSQYMQVFLNAGFQLTRFDEPRPKSGAVEDVWAYMSLPSIMTMEWKKSPLSKEGNRPTHGLDAFR